MLHCGDSLVVLPTLAEASVEAVVTDPPYALTDIGRSFQGKGGTLKPNGKPRSENRSTGFMGKVWDGELPGVDHWQAALRVLSPGGYMLCFGGTRTFHRLACAVEDAGFQIRDCLMWLYATGFPKGKACLKPAWEPILLCRKPGRGVRALNIEECRVGYDGKTLEEVRREAGSPGKHGGPQTREKYNRGWADDSEQSIEFHLAGRYPANVIHDGSEEVLEAFAAFGQRQSGGKAGAVYERKPDGNCYGDGKTWGNAGSHSDSGTAARFFFCAKASKAERGEGNTHPCVKPLSLVRWLVRLVSLPGETVLDPFAGSGTTPLACEAEGRQWVAIEREPEYVAIAEKRLAAARAETPLFPEAV